MKNAKKIQNFISGRTVFVYIIENTIQNENVRRRHQKRDK